MRTKVASLLVALFTIVGLGLVTASPAQAASSNVLFSNSAANPSSFDCYTKKSGTWKKLNDGDSRTISKKTPVKCDAKWRVVTWSGQTPVLKASQAYIIGDAEVSLNWAVARKA